MYSNKKIYLFLVYHKVLSIYQSIQWCKALSLVSSGSQVFVAYGAPNLKGWTLRHSRKLGNLSISYTTAYRFALGILYSDFK